MKKLLLLLVVFVLISSTTNQLLALNKYKVCPKCNEINYKGEKDTNFCFLCGEDLTKLKYKLRSDHMIITESLNKKIKELGEARKLSAEEWYQRGATSEDEIMKMACFTISLENQKEPAVYNNLGVLYDRRQLTKEAKEAFLAAIELDPLYHRSWNNLGKLYMDEGDLTEAERHLQKALSLDPKNPFYIKNNGDLLMAQGKPDEAEKLYQKTLRLDPKGLAGRTAAFKLTQINYNRSKR